MPLIEFERFIDESVLKRGRTYFKKGFVTQFEEITDGKHEAIVGGTEDYSVRLNLTDGIISECLCDCPYDMGPIYKHIVAVCFCLRQGIPNLKKIDTGTVRSRIPTKRKTIEDKVSELLEKITHNDLKQFTSEVVLRDRSLREMFLSSFAAHDAEESKVFYLRWVKAILRSASDKHGFIGWHTSGRVGKEVSRLLDSAQKQINGKNYVTAIYICTAVMEQMTKALQYADDSNGDIGGRIEFAFEILFNTAAFPLPEEVRLHLIGYCFTAFDKKIYEGWDWHARSLQLASSLLKTEEELQLLLARTTKAGRSDYEVEEAQSISYRALLKIRGEQEAEMYLEQHLANPELRKEAIEKALNKKQYEKARADALDGVELYRKDKPGLVQELYDWLLKVAQTQRDHGNIIKYARLLFIRDFRHEQDYYELMKQNVPMDKWTTFVEEIIKDIATKTVGYAASQIANIYIREAWWDRLLTMVKNSPSLNALERYEPHLKKDHADELAILYADSVLKYVKENTGRQHYKTAARYLRRIKKLGSPQKASEIAATLRAEYPQRRALQEELDLV
jgi:hypothetical protein